MTYGHTFRQIGPTYEVSSLETENQWEVPCNTQQDPLYVETSSAGAERSDGPYKGGLRRDGPNDFMFVNNLIQRDLSISILFVFIFLVLLFMFSIFCNLSTVNNVATYTY